jgi:O-antigen ligase
MVIQLLVLALAFFGLASWFFIKKKKVLGITFILIGVMALALFFIVRMMYPHRVPF